MKPLALSVAFATGLPAAALADCGDVTMAEFGFSSSIITTAVATFLMEQGYGCTVTKVPSEQIPAITSLAENNEPDLVSEIWTNSAGQVYEEIKAAGKIRELTNVLRPGGIEGWWIPDYLAEEHPELTTMEGILAHPELVDNRFHNCISGWVCRIINRNNARAWGMEAAGIEILDHGSAETLASSLAAAYENRAPWFGYYWGPTEVMGRYNMVPVDFGDPDLEVHKANTEEDRANPEASAYPPSLVYSVTTTAFAEREPEVTEMMSKLHFDTDEMSRLLAWKEDNNASNEETAVKFLRDNPDQWSSWLSEDARNRLAALLN